MLRWTKHRVERGAWRRGRHWRVSGVALVGLLGVAPGCLNPDISDEYPITTEFDALDRDDTTSSSEGIAGADAGVDDTELGDDAVTPDAPAPPAGFGPRQRPNGARR